MKTANPAVTATPAQIRAALSGNGNGFYDHLIRAIARADRENLNILRGAYPTLVADVRANR